MKDLSTQKEFKGWLNKKIKKGMLLAESLAFLDEKDARQHVAKHTNDKIIKLNFKEEILGKKFVLYLVLCFGDSNASYKLMSLISQWPNKDVVEVGDLSLIETFSKIK